MACRWMSSTGGLTPIRGRRCAACLLTTPKIIVRLIDPVASNGTKHVDRYGIFQHFHFVSERAGNLDHVAGTRHDLALIELELQRAAQHTGDLFVHVGVAWHDAAT